jgi:hypothetical protein
MHFSLLSALYFCSAAAWSDGSLIAETICLTQFLKVTEVVYVLLLNTELVQLATRIPAIADIKEHCSAIC